MTCYRQGCWSLFAGLLEIARLLFFYAESHLAGYHRVVTPGVYYRQAQRVYTGGEGGAVKHVEHTVRHWLVVRLSSEGVPAICLWLLALSDLNFVILEVINIGRAADLDKTPENNPLRREADVGSGVGTLWGRSGC